MVNNHTEFLDYQEAQLWVRIVPPQGMEPAGGSYSVYVIQLWQSGAPAGLLSEKGIKAAAGSYSQTTETLVPQAWAATFGDFTTDVEAESWSFRLLSDDLPVSAMAHYRVFFGDEKIGYYDLLVDGLQSNQDYAGVLIAEEDALIASIAASGRLSAHLSGIFSDAVLSTEFVDQ